MHRSFIFPVLYFIGLFSFALATEVAFPSDDLPFEPLTPSCYIYEAAPIDADAPFAGKAGDPFNAVVSGGACPAAKGIKILVTNDVHGNAMEKENRGLIGYARLDAYADRLRNEGWDVILMDAGDAVSGNSLTYFDAGKSIAELMGKIGYRVIAPGNHEFDYNVPQNDPGYYTDTLVPIIRDNDPETLDLVSVNIRRNGLPVQGIQEMPVVVRETNAFRLVVTGVLTPYAKTFSNAAGLREYEFGIIEKNGEPDHAATKANILNQLKNAVWRYDLPGDVVLVLSHIGYDETNPDYQDGNLTGKDVASVANVDVVVDSQSHNIIPVEKIGSAWYTIPGRYLENIAEITVTREGERFLTGMELKAYADISDVSPSLEMLRDLRQVSDRMGLGDRLFELKSNLLGDENLSSDSIPLGRFVCQTLNAVARTEVAIFNAGGIRSGFGQGWVTVGDIYDCFPFQNNLLRYEMSGRELAGQLRKTLSVPVTNSFPQFAGFTVYAWQEKNGKEYGIAGFRDADGEDLDSDRIYSVALISFLANGGDNYVFDRKGFRHDLGDASTLIIQYLRNQAEVNLDKYRDDNFLLYPTREEAEAAFKAGGKRKVA